MTNKRKQFFITHYHKMKQTFQFWRGFLHQSVCIHTNLYQNNSTDVSDADLGQHALPSCHQHYPTRTWK